MRSEILSNLPSQFPWRNSIHYFDTIDSTNTYAKRIAAQGACHGTVIVAGAQSAGRGRMGRSFHSPENGGIYLSVILRPGCSANALMHLTCAVGVAMCDAVQECTGIRPGIKWINDLVIKGKKVGGILTEMSITADGNVEFVVVGIGINCNQTADGFPGELLQIATSLFAATGIAVSLSHLAAAMIRHIENMTNSFGESRDPVMRKYSQDCITLHKEVVIHTAYSSKSGFAYGIDDYGGLLVRYPDGSCEVINSGEASVRGLDGYT